MDMHHAVSNKELSWAPRFPTNENVARAIIDVGSLESAIAVLEAER
jgi:hypothetical protein